MIDTYLRSSLSRMQASLFEMSGNLGYDSERFITIFMKSKVARDVDSEFNFIHWAGKEYILERMQDEYPEAFSKEGIVYDGETLY